MARLPTETSPYELARCYPRIVNQIARILSEPEQLERYMDSLLLDHRGQRQGFPAAVARDLMQLHLWFQARGAYTPPRPRTNIAPQRSRSTRHADHELMLSILSPNVPGSRRRPVARPRPTGFWSRIVHTLRPSLR